MKKIVQIEGMKCQGCADIVTEKFQNAGADKVEVNLENKQVTVEGDGGISLDALKDALSDTKFTIVSEI